MPQLPDFISILRDNPMGITPEIVDGILRQNPYFTLPVALLLKRDNEEHFLSPEKRQQYMTALALNSADTATLMQLVDTDGQRWLHFYPPEEKKKPSTETTIDTFLDTYGHIDKRENDLLERLIFNPVPDYSQILEMEEQESGGAQPQASDGTSQVDRINTFIARSRQPQASHAMQTPQAPEPATTKAEKVPTLQKTAHQKPKPAKQQPENKGLLSESLAKIYIKQGKYEKAYEILSNLGDNFPGKSRFHDDQMRFLRKLIVNKQHIAASSAK